MLSGFSEICRNRHSTVFFHRFQCSRECFVLHRNHVKIPDEISVAGMDDDVFASIVYPRLTTIRVNVEEKAETAVEVLMKL